MKVKLPIIGEQKIKKNEIITQESEIEIEILPVLAAQMNWERYFPELARKIKIKENGSEEIIEQGIFEYMQKISSNSFQDEYKNNQMGLFISFLKPIYCMIDEIHWTFKEFVKMINPTNKCIEQLEKIIKISLGSSIEKN